MAVGAAGHRHCGDWVPYFCVRPCPTRLILPIVFTAAYAFLSIRIEDTSILDFIRYALQFFVLRQQTYDWGIHTEAR